MVKREKISGRTLCRMVFKTIKKWITAKELCDIAKEKGYFKLYDSEAIDETAAIKAFLYMEAKEEDGEFISDDSFPVKFQLRERYIENDRKKENKRSKLNIKSSKETRSKFLQLAVKVLGEEGHPLTASDIWDIAVDKRYDKYLESIGETPRATLSSMLSTNSIKENGIFTASDSRPTQYTLRSWEDVTSTLRNLKPNNYNNSSKINKSPRKPLDTNKRLYIWRRFWNKMDGKCVVCGRNIAVENFEAGHIESVADGGGDDVLNFAPICGGCNSGMKTENMIDYKNRVFPHVHVKSLVILFP